MASERQAEYRRSLWERRLDLEPADEWREEYGRGGPVRSDEPERDWFFERNASPAGSQSQREQYSDQHQLRRMSWRAAGAQDYPGGAYEALSAASHRGRGPKGYRPSDERLREIICERLTDDPFIDASDVTIDVRNCEVTVSGTVETRRMKFAIEDLIADVHGATEIHNLLQLRSGEERGDS
jgi:hypothetical protein